MTPCILTPDHARALGISPEGLPVNLADPVDALDKMGSWTAGRVVEIATKLQMRGDPGRDHCWLLIGRLIAYAQAGTLKLPEVKAKVHEFGGVRFEEDKARPLSKVGWWTDGPHVFYDRAATDESIPLRPILPPPRVELKLGDRLVVKGEPKEHPLAGSGWLPAGSRESRIERVRDDVTELVGLDRDDPAWYACARSTIDAAVAAGTLEVKQ